jgi:mRNA-degrading endonuclease toxin of MazEF toxin-antitoxin module
MNKGEVWDVKIPSSKGHEQHGKRPVIIYSMQEANVIENFA